ncbi:MAG: glycine cleavage system aminomethyltransferase GcvT [Planctomycetota bacterium]|nr:MAG: glycine cleavage system aminomethyltransferase GcvT [Planctomycetota bacterium]
MTDSSSAPALRKTPLHSWHVGRGARMVAFAGYEMPVLYTSIVAEHQATRQAAGAFDISHMGRLRFEGPRAGQLLDHLLTRRVSDLAVGRFRYSLICNEEGGILDDVLISFLESPSGRQFYLMVVNAGNHAKICRWLTPHAADYPDVHMHDATDSTAMISVQGPHAEAIVAKLFDVHVVRLKYYRGLVTEQMGKACIVSRTGYTGEDGFELIVKADDALRVWENVMLAGRDLGIEPAGLGARDTLRLEAGMPLYGHELSESIDPFSADLGFAVDLAGDRTFIGADALRRLASRPTPQVRVGLTLEGRRPAREGAQVLDTEGRTVGEVTSGTFSPTLQRPIAMAYLARELARPDQIVQVDIRGSRSDARVVELPFYRRPRPSP